MTYIFLRIIIVLLNIFYLYCAYLVINVSTIYGVIVSIRMWGVFRIIPDMFMYNCCKLCPRSCGVNRNDAISFCNNSSKVKIAKAYLHYYEEPCISGNNGSGTIFFSGCNLRCVYCQNKEISHNNFGANVSIERFAQIMIELQNKKANNINLVTPTHFVPSIIEAIKIARKNGLNIPIIYNTSGYESVDTIKLLNGYIDIYLTDFKYFNNDIALKYSKVNNYFESASGAINEMKKQIPNNIYDDNGILKKGIIVRHLILPNNTLDSKNILKYLFNNYGNTIIYSIMNQYTVLEKLEFDELNRGISDDEYDSVINFACDLGITNAYVQEGGTVSDSFIPQFDLEGVKNSE